MVAFIFFFIAFLIGGALGFSYVATTVASFLPSWLNHILGVLLASGAITLWLIIGADAED